jgi:hypothetical protein
VKALARVSIGRRWVYLGGAPVMTTPTRWMGLSGLWRECLERLELAEEAVVLRV